MQAVVDRGHVLEGANLRTAATVSAAKAESRKLVDFDTAILSS